MTNTTAIRPVFNHGDEVILAEGSYKGTPGVFLRLRPDANWADITERNGTVRSHPMAWLAHAEKTPPARGDTSSVSTDRTSKGD